MNEAILTLAEAAGIAVDWTDAYGKPQRVATETLARILDALGYPCATDAQSRDSLARLKAEEEGAALPVLLTAEANKPLVLPLHHEVRGKTYRIEFEDGGEFTGRFPDLPRQPAELPRVARIGYHRLTVGDAVCTLAVAPARCFGVGDAAGAASGVSGPAPKKLWGLAAQLYSLRRTGDLGIGDFTALAGFVKSAARHGASAVAISPTHAMFSADRERFSPYGPSSRLFTNALHIDPAAVMGEAALARALADTGQSAAAVAALEAQELVDWKTAAPLRLALLRHLYRQFMAAGEDVRQPFAEFRRRGGELLEDHARFEALHAHFLGRGESGDWRRWPEAFRDPRGAAVAEFAAAQADEVGFHAFLQWQADLGMAAAQHAAREAGMPVGLIADLAVGADTGGSQAWSRQAEMINGLSIGAPPDLLNAKGQSWGLGAFNPRAMKRLGFRAYIEMLRAAFGNAGGVRIDHVLGLQRMWLVPDGASATEGAYLRFPIDDLLRLIALESWRHRAIVIGEDLGTVPPGFDTRLGLAGVLGIRVLWFQREQSGFRAPTAWSPEAIATTTTHDLPTVAGWWSGRDITWRANLDLLEAGATEASDNAQRETDRAQLWQALTLAGCADGPPPPATVEDAPLTQALCFIGRTPAPLAIVPVEDALGLPEQPNIPGTIDTHPNWRRRLPAAADSLLDDPAVAARLAALDQARRIV